MTTDSTPTFYDILTNHVDAKLAYLQYISENATLLLAENWKDHLEHVEIFGIVIGAELDALNFAIQNNITNWIKPFRNDLRTKRILATESFMRQTYRHPLSNDAVKKAYDEAFAHLATFKYHYAQVESATNPIPDWLKLTDPK